MNNKRADRQIESKLWQNTLEMQNKYNLYFSQNSLNPSDFILLLYTLLHFYIFQEALPDFKNVPYYEEAKGLKLQRPHDIHWEALQRAEALVNCTFQTVISIGKE